MKFFLSVYEWLQKNIRPPSAFSWQTMILLSLFSLYMQWLAANWFIKSLLNNFVWIFLIWGVYWATTSTRFLRIGYDKEKKKDGFPLSPWITGALVSYYIFSSRTGELRPETIIYWPSISAVIAAIPDFVGDELRIKKPPQKNRQNLVVLFGTQFLISCWFQFYFVLQNWVVEYPSLLVDDVRKSAFVVKWDSPLEKAVPRGSEILDSIEDRLKQQWNNKPWPQVERSLLPDNRNKLINSMAQQTKKEGPPVEEDRWWKVKSDVKSRKSGYNLMLQANWEGPRSRPQKKYALTKFCQITPVRRQASPATKSVNTGQASPTAISRVECKPVKGWGIDEPQKTNDTITKT